MRASLPVASLCSACFFIFLLLFHRHTCILSLSPGLSGIHPHMSHITTHTHDTHETIGDTRETASVFVCRNLLEERARLFVFDPKVRRHVDRRGTGGTVVCTSGGVEAIYVCVLPAPAIANRGRQPDRVLGKQAAAVHACTDGRTKSIT